MNFNLAIRSHLAAGAQDYQVARKLLHGVDESRARPGHELVQLGKRFYPLGHLQFKPSTRYPGQFRVRHLDIFA